MCQVILVNAIIGKLLKPAIIDCDRHMTPRKLTEDDKQNMLELYRNSKATTSTLASEFGVSSSTVSRFLKNSLSQEEYEDLIQQKRLARTPRGEKKAAKSEPKAQKIVTEDKPAQTEVDPLKSQPTLSVSQQIILPTKKTKPELKAEVEIIQETETTSEETTPSKPVRRSRKRTAIEDVTREDRAEATSENDFTESIVEENAISTPVVIEPQKKIILKSVEENEDDEDDEDDVDVMALSEMLGEEIDDDDDDDEDDDGDDDDESLTYTHPNTKTNTSDLEILPLSAASFPRTCYLVVDRSAELIVKPLQEFADLGIIPDAEVQQKTLPVFDNHRIAKRFSHRREKVIKVPDGKMLQKTSQYLYEKGITRLLIRGQIYAIIEN